MTQQSKTPKTLNTVLSDAVIKRNQKTGILKIKDARHPVEFRYHNSRVKGSWYIIKHAGGKSKWFKVGNYPDINTKTILNRLSDLMAKLALGHESQHIALDNFETIGSLFNWYQPRYLKNRNISDKRKSTVKSAIKCHLMPKVGHLKLVDINHHELDSLLLWPLQADYSLSNTRLIFDILKNAFKEGFRLKLIEHDLIASYKFSDFIQAQIKPKPGKLKASDIPQILLDLERASDQVKMLVLLMLLYGTRIGETRLAKWSDVDGINQFWYLPAENTKSKRGHKLPVSDQGQILFMQYRDEQTGAGYQGVYLFPGAKGKPLSPSDASELIRMHSKGKWTAHDLRKVARTVWADIGVDYMVGEVLLNHALSKLDRTYIHTHVEEQTKQAIFKYHRWLDKQGFSSFQTKTVQRQAEIVDDGSDLILTYDYNDLKN